MTVVEVDQTTTIESLIPSSPKAQYLALRDAGFEHGEAVGRVAHAYSRARAEAEETVASARAEFDARQEVETGDEPTPVVTRAEPDPIDQEEAKIRARVESLRALRQSLALDALTDPAKAEELAGAEADLADADAALERLGLARVESARREQADRESEEASARAATLHRAGELQADRAKAAAKVDRMALAFAKALAEHQEIVGEQARVLSVLGFGWDRIAPRPGVL